MTFTKIQVIKILRDQIPGLGLRDAKEIVDGYEVKSFEDRVARALVVQDRTTLDEARSELRQWALLYNMKREEAFNAVIPVKEYEEYKYSKLENDEIASEDWRDVDDDGGFCYCDDCVADRRLLGLKDERKFNSTIWCDITGIRVIDPDGWNRKNYEKSWGEEITRETFIGRAMMSTCERWPDPLYDEGPDY